MTYSYPLGLVLVSATLEDPLRVYPGAGPYLCQQKHSLWRRNCESSGEWAEGREVQFPPPHHGPRATEWTRHQLRWAAFQGWRGEALGLRNKEWRPRQARSEQEELYS